MPTDTSRSIWRTFPRTHYLRSEMYTFPERVRSAHIRWAARVASAEWAERDGVDVDVDSFRLAVLDKATELNEAQWTAQCVTPSSKEWEAHTAGYIYVAYMLASRQLAPLSRAAPSQDDVLPFCRAAMDACRVPLLDAPGAVRDIDLGRYEDAALRYANGENIAGAGVCDAPLERATVTVEAKIVRQPHTGTFVLDMLDADEDSAGTQERDRSSSRRETDSNC